MLTLSQTRANPISDPASLVTKPSILQYAVFTHGKLCFILSYFSAAKPIDLLAKYVNMTEDDLDIEVQEPYHLLRVGR